VVIPLAVTRRARAAARRSVLLIGVPAAVAAGLLVAVTTGLLGGRSVDTRTVNAAHRFVLHHHGVLTAARAATTLGAPLVVDVAAAVAAVVLWLARRRVEAVFVVGVRFAAAGLSGLAKAAIARPRPALLRPVAHASGFSFPSGHATGAASLYLPLALVVVGLLRSAVARLAAVTVAGSVCLVVATTRVLLGVHYPSDVIAGLATGALVTAAGWRLAAGRLGRNDPNEHLQMVSEAVDYPE
jgi:undecaprenyl-diphosphatase